MQAAPHARIDDFLTQLIGGVEVMHRVEVAGGTGGVEPVDVDPDLFGAKELRHDACNGRSNRPMRAGVLRMIWRVEQRAPARLLHRHVVAIVIPGHGAAPIVDDRCGIDR